MSTETAASCLLDVVVFAGGDSLDLAPLSAVEQKTMLRVCNRPLIWYSLTPWIDAGFSTFFLCVNEDYAALRAYLSRAFSGVDFHYILVPSSMGDHASTTCDAVQAYLRYKEALRLGEEESLTALPGMAGAREDSVSSLDAAAAASPSERRGSVGQRGGSAARGSSSAGTAAGSGARESLRLERLNCAGLSRDAILLSSDVVLVDVDIAGFVERHYASQASATAMLYRPLPQRVATGKSGAPGERKGAGRSSKGAAAAQEPPHAAFTHAFSCVAYGEEDAEVGRGGAEGSGAAGSSAKAGRPPFSAFSAQDGGFGSADAAADAAHVSHHRLHYIYPLEGKPEVRVTMAFAARRPELTFAADVVDAHVYLVSRWVLDFIAESAGVEDTSVRKDIFPLLARSQHTMMNVAEKSFVTPADKLRANIPMHWTGVGADLSVRSLTSARGLPLPESTDPLRVFCSIYEEQPDTACRIYRVNTRDNYRALHHEIISAKGYQLQLEEAGRTHLGADGGRGGLLPSLLQHSAHGHHGAGEGKSGDGKPPPSLGAVALAALLPDNPITLREKIVDQQVYIVNSFIDSVPPPNVFITRSVIGAHVTLKPGARITDSILMGNVEVGAGAVVTHSIIGTGAVIPASRRVISSIVAPRCEVEEDVEDTVVE